MKSEVVHDRYAIVRVTGDIDIASIPSFAQSLGEGVQESPDGLILDLTEVTYIDSTGVKAIVAIYKKMRESGGCIIIIAVNTRVRIVVDHLQLDQLPCLCVCSSMEEARETLKALISQIAGSA